MKNYIQFIERLSLTKILVIALFFRVCAAIFSPGYGMYDDHFYTIEIAQEWAEGLNLNHWLPDNETPEAGGHPHFYARVLWLFMLVFKVLGIANPMTKMLIIRLVHAFYSLLVIFYTFKIVKQLSNEYTAKLVSFILAIVWFLPMMSVRNLVEVVCIPPMLAAMWLLIKENKNLSKFLFAGLLMAIAVSIRYQNLLVLGGMGLASLINKEFKKFWGLSFGSAIGLLLTLGLYEYLIWGKPFAEIIGYYKYNINNSGAFPNGPWYNYILLISGLFLIPFGLVLWPGYIIYWRKYLLLWLPSLLFFAFHSYFPNKQERFILPVATIMFSVGMAGWVHIYQNKNFINKWVGLQKASIWFFILINTSALLFISFSSTKISRVNAMYFFFNKPNVQCYAIEKSYSPDFFQLPQFYAGRYMRFYWITSKESENAIAVNDYIKHENLCMPEYFIFQGDKELSTRLAKTQQVFGKLSYETSIEPSPLDKLMYWLNPVNENEAMYIFKVIK
ncbi:MAG: ArnT family glycosyltransferase [Bacteroidia bacterium]